MEEKRKVAVEEGQNYAESVECIHMQTSAKTGLNIKKLFLEIGTYRVAVLFEAPTVRPIRTRAADS